MKYYLSCILFLGMLVFNQSCKTAKASEMEKETQVDSNDKISDGYKKGVLKRTRVKSCPYTITVDTYSDSLDPVNIEDFFKENMPEKVWVKFTSLRMRNRCDMGRPIHIVAIEERVD
ncbi:hypothetical protein [uncultured Aquimarina sp.]|uniref:hypothetical protein n=1 Tax=uncultured Aquimarina sp. TaxID=575652 RepID=UPI00262320A5|nr:hypothetical protein [uncultured Aquimarina sp.]